MKMLALRYFCIPILCMFLTVSLVFAQTDKPIQIGEVDGAILNNDGTLTLTWSSEGTAKIIDTVTGQEKLSLEHGDSLLGATWNDDSSSVLTWSADNIRVWNAQNGNQLLGIKTEGLIQAEWLTTGHIFAWSEKGILIWDAKSGDGVFSIEDEGITGASISGDGLKILWWKANGEASQVNIGGENVVSTADQQSLYTVELTAGDITPGKWQVTWGESLSSCAQIPTTSDPRPFMMLPDAAKDTFSTEDIFLWSLYNFVYKRNAEGKYAFLRNQNYPDGSVRSYEYITQIMSPTRIEGVVSDYATGVNCANRLRFILTLMDESVICMVGSTEGANSRSGPGTSFNRLNPLKASTPADVVGQGTGEDNLVWWKLSDDSWVREDVVTEIGDCKNVPQAQP